MRIEVELTGEGQKFKNSLANYSGFRLRSTPDGPRGVLAIAGAPPRMDNPKIEIVKSRLSAVDLSKLHTASSKIPPFRDGVVIGNVRLQAVSYDPFDDNFITHYLSINDSAKNGVRPGTPSENIRSIARSLAAEAGLKEGEEMLERVVEGPAHLSSGGLTVTTNSSFFWGFYTESLSKCTTGFGVYSPQGNWDYTTAAHCQSAGVNNVNSFPIYSIHSRRFGGYQDVMMLRGNGAYWTTQTNPGVFEDMDSDIGHIFQGTYYCNYGMKTAARQCSVVASVNQPVPGQGTTIFTSKSFTSRCRGGDSGGPVWQPAFPESKPAGMIDAALQLAPDGSGYCGFVALDDQLNGTGWVLL